MQCNAILQYRMTEFPKKFLPLNGHTVMKATGPNGNHIYFPHTGTTKIIDEIYCWTSDLELLANHHAVCYSIRSFWGTAFKTWEDRYTGLTIRAVCP